MNNTFMANPDKVERKWYVVDATGYTLGRLSSEIAKILRGKNKAVFTPHNDYIITCIDVRCEDSFVFTS